MVINLCSPNFNTNNSNQISNQFRLQELEQQNQLREQLCAIQNHHLQRASNPTLSNQSSPTLAALDTTQVPFNQYTSSASNQPSPSSASLLLAAQLLFGSNQTENTPPHLVSSLNSSIALLSPQNLMDTSTAHQLQQNASSANSADGKSIKTNTKNSQFQPDLQVRHIQTPMI